MPLDDLKSIGFMDMGHMKVKERRGIDELLAIKLFFGIVSDLYIRHFR
jgi:hypothetical protein